MKVLINIHLGDSVWLMNNNQVVVGYIKKIMYSSLISNVDHESIVTVEKYVVGIKDPKYVGGEREVTCDKTELFSTKELLIQSL